MTKIDIQHGIPPPETFTLPFDLLKGDKQIDVEVQGSAKNTRSRIQNALNRHNKGRKKKVAITTRLTTNSEGKVVIRIWQKA